MPRARSDLELKTGSAEHRRKGWDSYDLGAQEVITPRSPSAADIPAGMGERILECIWQRLQLPCNWPGMHTRLGRIAIVWALNVGGRHFKR